MATRPNLSGIEEMMRSNKDFSLTSVQYEHSTGIPLPKDKSYTEKRSAVAKCARQHGFRVEVVPATIQFIKSD